MQCATADIFLFRHRAKIAEDKAMAFVILESRGLLSFPQITHADADLRGQWFFNSSTIETFDNVTSSSGEVFLRTLLFNLLRNYRLESPWQSGFNFFHFKKDVYHSLPILSRDVLHQIFLPAPVISYHAC